MFTHSVISSSLFFPCTFWRIFPWLSYIILIFFAPPKAFIVPLIKRVLDNRSQCAADPLRTAPSSFILLAEPVNLDSRCFCSLWSWLDRVSDERKTLQSVWPIRFISVMCCSSPLLSLSGDRGVWSEASGLLRSASVLRGPEAAGGRPVRSAHPPGERNS